MCSFGIGLTGSIFDILNILFSYIIIALFFRHRTSRVFKFIDLLSRQAGKFESFSLSVLKFGVVLGDGGGGGGGYLPGEDGRGGVLVGDGDGGGGGGGSNNEKIFLVYNEEDSVSAFLFT